MSAAQIIAELARAKATFQLRAIKAAMGWPYAVRDSRHSPNGGDAARGSGRSPSGAVPEGQSPK